MSYSVKIKKIDENAKIPTRKFPTDAGMDVYALNDEYIHPHSFKIVKTGVTCEFPEGTVIFVWPKSRAEFLIGAGVIDNNYQGEILIKVFNVSNEFINIKRGQGIAQLVITPVSTPSIVEVDEIHNNKTERGDTGGICGNS